MFMFENHTYLIWFYDTRTIAFTAAYFIVYGGGRLNKISELHGNEEKGWRQVDEGNADIEGTQNGI